MRETKEDLQRENEWLKLEVKEQKRNYYLWMSLFFFLLIFFIIIGIRASHCQEENEQLKSQIQTWTLKVHCESFFESLTGKSDFELNFKDYETYNLAKGELLKALKESDFKNCEVLK